MRKGKERYIGEWEQGQRTNLVSTFLISDEILEFSKNLAEILNF